MKKQLCAFTASMLAVLLLLGAACAQDADPAYYEPMESDAGQITVDSVYKLASADEETQAVRVTLHVPEGFLAGITDLDESLSEPFFIVSTIEYGVFFPEEITADTDAQLRLRFSLPAEGEAADYNFVYIDQARTLAKTGDEPGAFIEIPAEEALAAEAAQEPAETIDPDEAAAAAAVLEALDEPLYTAAYDSLAGGALITVDDRSEDAKGLQTMLKAFGYPLTADGWAGKKTFAKLNELRETYGLEAADTIGADGFIKLLSYLLVQTDPDTAEDLLYDTMISASEFNYLSGCAALAEERYFAAEEYFNNSDWKDAAQRAKDCVLPWPKTGELYHSSKYRSSAMTLNIKIASQDTGKATYVKIYADSGTLASTMFIDGSATVGTDLPGGIYSIKLGVGKAWYGEADAFGSDGYYETMVFNNEETEVELESGYDYTLTINTTYSNPDAEGVDSEYTEWSAF